MQPRDPISVAFVYGLGAAVTIAWFVSVIASVLTHGYQTPVALHGLMGTVVGSVFADAGLRRARRNVSNLARREKDHTEHDQDPDANSRDAQ